MGLVLKFHHGEREIVALSGNYSTLFNIFMKARSQGKEKGEKRGGKGGAPQKTKLEKEKKNKFWQALSLN